MLQNWCLLLSVVRVQEFHGSGKMLPEKFVSLSSDFVCHRLSCLPSYHVLVSYVLLMWHRSISSEPSALNPTSEAAPSSSGTSETVKAPSDPSLSPGPRTPEKETQRDGEVEASPEGETEEEKAIRLLYCSLCKVAVNSASQLQAHNSGEILKAPLSFKLSLLLLCLMCLTLCWHASAQAQSTRPCWRQGAAMEPSSPSRGRGSRPSWPRRPSCRLDSRTKHSTVRSAMCTSTPRLSSNRLVAETGQLLYWLTQKHSPSQS